MRPRDKILIQLDERIPKLPVWARDLVADLWYENNRLKHQLGAFKRDGVGEKVRRNYGGNEDSEYLPADDPYFFKLKETGHSGDWMQVRLTDDGLEISAGSGIMVITPSASNAVNIKQQERVWK